MRWHAVTSAHNFYGSSDATAVGFFTSLMFYSMCNIFRCVHNGIKYYNSGARNIIAIIMIICISVRAVLLFLFAPHGVSSSSDFLLRLHSHSVSKQYLYLHQLITQKKTTMMTMMMIIIIKWEFFLLLFCAYVYVCSNTCTFRQ